MVKAKTSILLVVVLATFSMPANAALIDRGMGMVYDTELGITWLQDANYAATSGYWDSLSRPLTSTIDPGQMNWNQATEWADQLEYGGYDDWRLPMTVDGEYVFAYDGTTTAGYNITTSELGYLYYNTLGNVGYYDVNGNPQLGYGFNNTGPFINVQFPEYWSGTEYSDNTNFAWSFLSIYGGQGIDGKEMGLEKYAWAVRNGDYGPSVSTTQNYLTDFLTLGDTFSFDYWWEMGTEPTNFNFDILFFNGTEWETFGWELNFGGSSDGWETASFYVPEWARGTEAQMIFSLLDWGQQTDPTVYLRNISSNSAPVPEPATLILLGTGLLGLAGASNIRFKR